MKGIGEEEERGCGSCMCWWLCGSGQEAEDRLRWSHRTSRQKPAVWQNTGGGGGLLISNNQLLMDFTILYVKYSMVLLCMLGCSSGVWSTNGRLNTD